MANSKNVVEISLVKQQMKYRCFFPNCTSAYRTNSQNKRFYQFPRNPEYREIWKKVCNVAPDDTLSHKICEDHFDSKDFYFPSSNRRLIFGAVPKHPDQIRKDLDCHDYAMDYIKKEHEYVKSMTESDVDRNIKQEPVQVQENCDNFVPTRKIKPVKPSTVTSVLLPNAPAKQGVLRDIYIKRGTAAVFLEDNEEINEVKEQVSIKCCWKQVSNTDEISKYKKWHKSLIDRYFDHEDDVTPESEVKESILKEFGFSVHVTPKVSTRQVPIY